MKQQKLTETLSNIGLYDIKNAYFVENETNAEDIKRTVYKSNVSDIKYVIVTMDNNSKEIKVEFTIK